MSKTNKRNAAKVATEAHCDAAAAGAALTSRPRLTDRQLVVLAAAAQRSDRVIALPETLKGKAREVFVQALTRRGLATKQPAPHDQPVWRQDGTRGIDVSLVVTTAGLAAIGVEDEDAGPAAEAVSASAAPGSDGEPDGAVADTAEPAIPEHASDAVANITLRAGCKQERLVVLLSGETGCSIGDAAAALGWLPHTTRAALTGLRRKGYVIERVKDAEGAGSRHRIVIAAPIAAAAA